MRILVVTVVHRPDDARILIRQIGALLAAGHEVTYAAPFSTYGVDRPSGIRTIDLPRASGRRRLTALRVARTMLKKNAAAHDAVILHDPELLVAARGLSHPIVIWDVHEDTAAAVALKPWLPVWARRPVASAVHAAEGRAERSRHLLLAEHAYSRRFANVHPVVPNTTVVQETVEPSGRGRAIYIGHLSEARGAIDLIEVGRRVAAAGISVEVVGHADAVVRGQLETAHQKGWIVWHGFVPNDRALSLLDGATAGLSLLHDESNYRESMPTKVIEYMAHGVPVITTPLPLAAGLVTSVECGVVVPFEDPQAVAEAVIALNADDAARARMAASGHSCALRDFNWAHDGREFVQTIETWVGQSISN